MPSTATITAFYSFTANTKARASQVNGNFDVFRGHLLPIDPNTQTATNLSYDLGSSDHQWRNLHVNAIYKTTNVTTTGSAIGQYTVGPVFTASWATTVVTNIAGSTATVITSGKPVRYGFLWGGIGTNSQVVGAATDSLLFMRDAVTVGVYRIGGTVPPSAVSLLDFPSAGTHNYYVAGKDGAAFTSVKPYAHEVTN